MAGAFLATEVASGSAHSAPGAWVTVSAVVSSPTAREPKSLLQLPHRVAAGGFSNWHTGHSISAALPRRLSPEHVFSAFFHASAHRLSCGPGCRPAPHAPKVRRVRAGATK